MLEEQQSDLMMKMRRETAWAIERLLAARKEENKKNPGRHRATMLLPVASLKGYHLKARRDLEKRTQAATRAGEVQDCRIGSRL
jgi:transcription elongation factor GreA-like protein